MIAPSAELAFLEICGLLIVCLLAIGIDACIRMTDDDTRD